MARLIFMGTSDFACRCLESLEQDNLKIELVITRPDSVSGRSLRPSLPPVKRWALSRGIKVWQPRNINSPESIASLKALAPDLFVVVAYGKILGKEVLAIPTLGSINVHASLLPKLRGAAPIEWALIHGYNKTGITTMYMDEGLDTGDIILQMSTEIRENENAGELCQRLAAIAQILLPKTVGLVIEGKAPRTPQPAEGQDYAPVLNSGLERIDWTRSPAENANYIRALAPKPGCYTTFRGKRLKILRATPAAGSASPGSIVVAGKSLSVGSGGGLLTLLEVQLEGKRIITAQEFINGYRVQEGELCV